MTGLAGVRVLVTRMDGQAGAFATLLRERGATTHCVPSMTLGPPSDAGPLERTIAAGGAREFDWIVFTSANAVHAWADACVRAGVRAAARHVAATGPATAAAARERGLPVELVPERYVAEAFARALVDAGAGRGRVLIPRAEEARSVVPDALREAGADVEVVPAYATRPALEHRATVVALRTEVDVLTFFSSKTVRSFLAQVGSVEGWQGHGVASVGPITSQTLRDAGFERMVEAHSATAHGVVAAVQEVSGKLLR